MSIVTKHCESCLWVDKFDPRPDEIKRGLVLGCKKPGWEGYTNPLHMACGGQFWTPVDLIQNMSGE